MFDDLNKEFRFTLDPCATKENAKCRRFFTEEDNGLIQDWSGERVFMNPPYGRQIGKWIEKAYSSGADVAVCLLPSRTDTSWWHDYCMKGTIRFIRGRVKFGEGKAPAPFPSVLVIFTKNSSLNGSKHAKSAPSTL